MTTHATSRRTAAIALAGASAITLATLAPAAEIPRIAPGAALSAALAAATDPIQAFIDDVTTQVSISGADRVNNPNPVPLADAPAHIAAGLVASAIRTGQGIVLAPEQFAALVSAIGTGDETKASGAIRDIIDGPLWAADPTLLSLWDAAPAPIGGQGDYTGTVWNFREQWRGAALDLENFILGALYPATSTSGLTTDAAVAATNPLQAFIDDVTSQVSISGADRVNNPDPVPLSDAPAHIAAGLAASAIRTVQGLVLGPQQVAALVTALSTGDKTGASDAIVNIIDGPLWSADPALLSVWDAAPKPIGGEGEYTGAAWNFRESWRSTGNTIESNVLDALKLPKPDKLTDTSGASTVRTVTLNVPAARAATPGDVSDKKAVSDQKSPTGTLSESTKKADDAAASSSLQSKSPFSSHRDRGATTAKPADSGASDKSADRSTGEKGPNK